MLTSDPNEVYSKSLKKYISKVVHLRRDGEIVYVWPWTLYDMKKRKASMVGFYKARASLRT